MNCLTIEVAVNMLSGYCCIRPTNIKEIVETADPYRTIARRARVDNGPFREKMPWLT